jgi:hypothetical protein
VYFKCITRGRELQSAPDTANAAGRTAGRRL